MTKFVLKVPLNLDLPGGRGIFSWTHCDTVVV